LTEEATELWIGVWITYPWITKPKWKDRQKRIISVLDRTACDQAVTMDRCVPGTHAQQA
jgi:hypothetical protein